MVSSLFLKDLEDSFIKSNFVKSRIFIDNSASVLQSELSLHFNLVEVKYNWQIDSE